MYSNITLRRGLDLQLQGGIGRDAAVSEAVPVEIAMTPDDFPGLTPKVVVKPGERIAAGQPLLIDKINEKVAIVSPVSGTVGEVIRGERRKIIRVTVKPDFPVNAVAEAAGRGAADKDAVKDAMMHSGLWAMMRQLPYDIVPEADLTPDNIFITTFDSAPLASDMLEPLKGKADIVKAGIKALLSQTGGHIYIGVRDIETSASLLGDDLRNSDRVTVAEIHGKHPAGLPSVQAANLAPVNKGQSVWLLDITTVARIGDVILNGHCDWTTEVALTG